MDRESSPTRRPAGATTKPNHLLEWVRDAAVDRPADTAAKAGASRAKAKPAGKAAPKAALRVTIDGAADERDEPDRPDAPAAPRKARKRAWWGSRKLRGLLAAGVAVLVAIGVYSLGSRPAVPGISGATTDQPSGAATQVDSSKVSALMKQLSANPKDVSALQSLGDVYFQAGDYRTAGGWESKILKVDPKNVTALLALGACQFNLGDGAAAEKNWLTVVKINPRQVEAHYDLGFLYLSKNPPDMAKVKNEWNTVVQIDPTSDVAKSVQAHLKSLDARSSTPPAGK